MFLAHELAHALDDQETGLVSRLYFQQLSSDEEWVLSSILEGLPMT